MREHPDSSHPIHRACLLPYWYQAFVENLARRTGITEAEDFAREWHILMKGSIVAALEGDREAARRGQKVGGLILRDELDAERQRENDRSWKA